MENTTTVNKNPFQGIRLIWVILGAILLATFLFVTWGSNQYNSLIQSREDVRTKIANLQSQYQRRSDLIPNVVKTVQANADFEASTLTQVIEARAKATAVTIDPKNASPEQLDKYFDSQNQFGSTISRLLAVSENYPVLTATEGFRGLTDELSNTENRINFARNDYNTSVQYYNTQRQKFPTSIIASLFGFEPFKAFQASESAQSAPSVEFNFPSQKSSPSPSSSSSSR